MICLIVIILVADDRHLAENTVTVHTPLKTQDTARGTAGTSSLNQEIYLLKHRELINTCHYCVITYCGSTCL